MKHKSKKIRRKSIVYLNLIYYHEHNTIIISFFILLYRKIQCKFNVFVNISFTISNFHRSIKCIHFPAMSYLHNRLYWKSFKTIISTFQTRLIKSYLIKYQHHLKINFYFLFVEKFKRNVYYSRYLIIFIMEDDCHSQSSYKSIINITKRQNIILFALWRYDRSFLLRGGA